MASSEPLPWRSAREVSVEKSAQEWLRQLVEADSEWDRPDNGPALEPSKPHASRARVWSRGVRLIARLWRRALRKVGCRRAQFHDRRVAHQRGLALADEVATTAGPARIVLLDGRLITEIRAECADVTEPFIIFVRNSRAVAPSELEAFALAIHADPLENTEGTSPALWYADSFDGNKRVWRPAPSRLLSEQVDWLGAVVMVRREVAISAVTDGISTAALLQQLALSVPVAQWRHVALPIGQAGFASAGGPAGPRAITDEVAPLVSIIIPTRGSGGHVAGTDRVFVVEAARSLMQRTDYPNWECVIVADNPTPQFVIDQLEELLGDRLRLVRFSDPFNFSAKMNLGAAVAHGELLLMLNDDIEVVTPEWLSSMVALLQRPEISAAGALLFFEDGTVQHGGHLYRGGAGHIGFGERFLPTASNPRFALDREVSGVTGACLLVSAEDFRRVGGFSLQFAGNYNDVDLCLKLRADGRSAAVSGAARLYHFESKTRDATVTLDDLDRLFARWSRELADDLFWPEP